MANYGVDVSQWNGTIDFAKLAAQLGKDGFVFIRALDDQGLAIDPKFKANWASAKAVGLRRGLYIPYYQSIAAGRQLFALLEVCKNDWGELPPVVDIESGQGVWTLEQNRALQWTMWTLTKCCGQTPLIYTSVGYWNAYVLPSCSGNPKPASTDNTWARSYPLWIANWSVAAGSTPPLPQPWAKYTYHQYGKGRGADYGAESAEIDLDIEYVDNPTPTPTYPTPVLKAVPTSITSGGSATLSWSNTDGANALYVNGSAVNGPSGNMIVTPNANTTYTLIVKYPDVPNVTKSVAILVTSAPVPVNTKPIVGMNVIFNGDDTRNAIARGCKFISCTFNPDLAWLMKQEHPDLLVGARGNFNKGALPSDAHFLDKVGAGIHPGVIVYGVNEQDHIDNDTPEQIKKRAEFDAKWWKYCKDRGAIYAGGGFSMGNPNIMNASMRAALRQYYAPLVNAGMWFNQHTYGGNDGSGIPLRERIFKTATWPMTLDGVTFTMRQTWWLEERWRFYCAVCGFDPTKFKFISDETGVDDNPGGFPSHNYTDQEVVAWCKRYVQITSEPVFYNGAFYPSNFIGGALFQSGDDAKWAGFECRQYWPALQAANWGQA